MGFFTEFFSRPRPSQNLPLRRVLAQVEAMSNRDRAEFAIRPADFPRIARQIASR